MRRILICWILPIPMSFGPVFGQGMRVVGAGYSNPTSIKVAPGQIIKLYLSGAKTVLPPDSRVQRASALPLPATLAGFSVSIRQGANTYAAPLVAVEQTAICADADASSSDCLTTALTVQIPFEIQLIHPGNAIPSAGLPGVITVNDNGAESSPFPIFPADDNIHVLTTCDVAGSAASGGKGWVDARGCIPIAARPDGTLVTADSPAKPGETIVVYAYGLGKTMPAVKTGEATPAPAPVLFSDNPFFGRTVGLQFDFRVNAGPSRPYVNPLAVTRPAGLGAPEFAGLTPGQVGLYQINVKLPETFPAVEPCTESSGIAAGAGRLSNVALSNLTIGIGGVGSFDGAAICVQPGQ